MAKKQMKCANCKGTGKKHQGGPLAISVTCIECKGTGYVMVEDRK